MKIQKSENIRTPHQDRVYEMLSRKTLNEEIGMSQQGIDYVNSLEVKDEYHVIENAFKGFQENYDKSKEKQRIKKEARNNLIFVAIVLIIVLIVNWKS